MMESRTSLHGLTFGLVGLCMVLGFASSATAFSSDGILMIDGSGDGMVDIVAFDTSGNVDFNFGFYDGGFDEILSAASVMGTETFYDGDIVDFAIQSATDSSVVYRLSDGDAVVTFNNDLDPTSAFIAWAVDNTNVVTRLSVGDTFALADASSAAPIPEPTAAVTFAAGLLLAGWQIRRHPRD